MAWLGQFAADLIEIRISPELHHEAGEPIATAPRAQVAPQPHHDERVIGQGPWEGHEVRSVVEKPGRDDCDLIRFGTFVEQTRPAPLVQQPVQAGGQQSGGDWCGRLRNRPMTTKAYADQPPPPIRGKQLAALRAVAGTPGGLRIAAYPSTMPLLVRMALVEERPSREAGTARAGRGFSLARGER